LTAVSPTTISTYFTSAVAGRWKRVTVSHHVQALRTFFRYAARRGWCTKGIAESIDAPRLYTYENLPQGPSWEEVQKLLANLAGSSPLQIRSRCAVLLCAVYGFRAGEVCRLRLADIDWPNEKITVRRFKQGKTQTYPLTTEMGNAFLLYLKEVRPSSACREVFLTLRQPYRPVSVGAFSSMVQKQQKRLGLHPRHFGPHALRHACATHLLAQGLTLKEVGDHLGHVSMAATRAYAKVDLPGLREVAAFDVKPVAECIAECERTAAPFYKVGEIAALREVARLGLGGVISSNVEVMKLAMADRERFLGDMDFIKIPYEGLLSKDYARERRKLIDPAKASLELRPGSPEKFVYSATERPWHVVLDGEADFNGDTSYIAIVDKDRNMVSFEPSLHSVFGTGVVMGNTGIIFNCRGDYYSLVRGEANALEPGKRPRSTLQSTLVMKDGQPFMITGSPGGDDQVMITMQTLVNVIDFGMN